MGNETKVIQGMYCMLTYDSALVSSNLAWGYENRGRGWIESSEISSQKR